MSASNPSPTLPLGELGDEGEPGVDARLLVPAAAGWLTAAVLVGQAARVSAVAAAVGLGATIGLIVLRLIVRHSGRPERWVVTGLGSALVVVGMSVAAGLHVHSVRTGPVADLAAADAVVTARLLVSSDPALRRSPGSRRPPYVVLRGTVEEITGRGQTWSVRSRVLVIGSPDWRDVRFGQRVELTGRLRPVEPGADTAAILSTRSRPRVVAEPAWWLRAAEHVRAGLRESVATEPEAVRGLVPALVMGDDAGLPAELTDDFRTTGLTHLSAVSGTNLTLLLAFVIPLARLVGVRARGLTAVGLFTVVAFVVLARPQPSVLRAAVMGLVALAAMTSGGVRRGVRSLSVAVLVLLLLDTSLARSAGFVLSVLATAGIVVLAPGWRDALARWLPGRLADAVACPLAAQIACTPVVAWLSGEVSLVAVVANLLAGPAVGPATILGFGAAGAALLSADLARLFGWLAAWPARWIIAIATHGADLPGAATTWPATVTGVAVLAGVCLVVTLAMSRVLTRPVLTLCCITVLIVAVLRPNSWIVPGGAFGWPPSGWLLVACDVGQGDGLVLRVGPGSAVVVDTGPEPSRMDRCLRDLGIRHVSVLLLTHFHADHVGGLTGVLDGRVVDEIEVSPYTSPPAEHRRVLELAGARRIPVRTASYGERRAVGSVSWTVIWPARIQGQRGGSDESPENNASVTMMVETAGLRILLTGDLEPGSQRAVLATGADLRADVIKVPHHGSGRQESSFVEASGARLAIVSAGAGNDYGHPAPRTLDLLRKSGMTLARTDTEGAVAVVRDGGQLAVSTSGAGGCRSRMAC